jgi:hypothetical protein
LAHGGPASAAPSAQVLGPGQVTEASPVSTGSAPADGGLRGADFTATITKVAWPQSVASSTGTTYVAGTGRRLVAFTLSVTQASADSGLGNAPTGVSASLKVGSTSLPISMSTVDQQIASGASGSAQTTGTDSFVASVPVRSPAVELSLSEGGFSQSFDLWTLKRVPPTPVVLYRDPTSSTVTGTAAGPFQVNFTNPADGFASSDDAQIQSATLTYFAPGASGITPGDPAQAFLVLEIQSSYPSVPYGQPNSGHFFSGFTPLAGNQLTFTPDGGSAVPATADSTDFSSTNAANDDDGLFDAIYSFTVPATTTGGTLSVLPGTAEGTEYTGFTGTGTTVPITINAGAMAVISFPAVPAAPAPQKKPPWVGAPLPATGLAAAPAGDSASSSHTSSGSSGGGGLPIWVVVLVLVLVAAGVIAWQRLRHRPTAAVVTPGTIDPAVPSTATPSTTAVEAEDAVSEVAESLSVAVPTPERATDVVRDGPRSVVLGTPDALAMEKTSERRAIAELFHYLALHDTHRRNAEQILVALRPNAGTDEDLTLKTIHTYLSELRACVGAEHLPSASVAGGYLLLEVTSDWADFVHLDRQADATGGDEAWALRFRALALVRGVPFAGVPADSYQWAVAEHLISTMTTAIARCARRLATELLEAGGAAGAEEAARAGLRGAPEDFELWRLGALALDARGDRSALRLWMTDARTHLEPDEIRRIHDELGGHDDPPDAA